MSVHTEPAEGEIDPDDFEGAEELRLAAYLEDHSDIDPEDWEEGDD